MLRSSNDSDMLVILAADKEINVEKNIKMIEHQLFAR